MFGLTATTQFKWWVEQILPGIFAFELTYDEKQFHEVAAQGCYVFNKLQLKINLFSHFLVTKFS